MAQPRLAENRQASATPLKAGTHYEQAHRQQRPVRPGRNAQSQLVWGDLERGVDVLGEDGTPQFVQTPDFLNCLEMANAQLVVRLHDEIVVRPNHDVIGEVFLGTPEQLFFIESVRSVHDNPMSIHVVDQLVYTDKEGRAKLVIGNGSSQLELLIPDSILGVAIPCPSPSQPEVVCGMYNQQKPLQPSPMSRSSRKSKGQMNCLLK